MEKPTDKQVKEVRDCSNCRFSKQVAPYKIMLECEIDMETKLMPHTCNGWENIILGNVRDLGGKG